MDPADVLNKEERRQIVEALYFLTTEERASWQGVAGNENFSLRMGSHEYGLYPKDHDGVAPFVLVINRDDGTVLAEISSSPRERSEYDPQINGQLESIYRMVYRKINRPEESVNKLMDEIRDITSGREPPF